MPPSNGIPVIPPLYAGWMDELLQNAIPPERAATCGDCAMCAPARNKPDTGMTYFQPDVKCCSFMPELWNFLVGRILDDDAPNARVGRASVERRIDDRVSVTPLGLRRTPTYAALYREVGEAFGRTRGMICPHFIKNTGGCGIWRHRESTCTTYFCKHERGATGKAFWLALQALLRTVETTLARHAVVELDPGIEALEALFPPLEPETRNLSAEDLDGTVDPVVARRRWGSWAGRERDFFRQSARLIAPLRWDQILAIGGNALRLKALLAVKAFERLRSQQLPNRLEPGAIHITPVSKEKSRVSGYSGLDPLELPMELLDVLYYFDGRPTAEAVQAIAAERELRITPALVRRLVDFGILESTA